MKIDSELQIISNRENSINAQNQQHRLSLMSNNKEVTCFF